MPHTCLVVSDDDVFTVLRDLLTDDKRALFHAPTGAAAVDWLAERRGPTIVIADLPLADMSGSELIESIACSDGRTRVAVVCLVGPGVRQPPRAFRALRKPATTRALVAAIADARQRLAAGGSATLPAVVAPVRF